MMELQCWVRIVLLVVFVRGATRLPAAEPAAIAKSLAEIRIRDPFILADETTRTYYMYAQMDNHLGKQRNQKGVEVYTSRDLQRWYGPEPVYVQEKGFWGNWMVWAPEVHRYRDKYYLFVTFTSRDTLPPLDGRPTLNKRGTQVLVADSPTGPFQPFHNRAHTSADWLALDGTLWVEGGAPWMIFCHEWVQTVDGTMELVQLKDDLSDVQGDPVTLFRATEGTWVRALGEPETPGYGFVTDGPFLYRTKTNKLLMIWSSFGRRQYAVGLAVSQSGKVAGPWTQLDKPLFAANGGHGMIFRTFEGQLMLALHQPNSGAKERAKLFKLKDTGELLEIE